MKAEEWYGLLKEHNFGRIIDHENGYSDAFCDISVGLYRESIPEDITQMTEEMKADGVSVADIEGLEYEKKKANYWATIEIGKKGYYD